MTKLGLCLADAGWKLKESLPGIQRADELGYDSVWIGESYGSDAVSVLGYLAASTSSLRLGTGTLQMHARTPAATAMTAIAVDHLSDDRLLLGLGVSGPQVVEGWHGVEYGKPLRLTREYVQIVRHIIARESPLDHAGDHFTIPYRGENSTGVARPMRANARPSRSEVPIFLGAIGPKNIELAGEIADGWLPIFYSPRQEEVLLESLDRGRARRLPGLGPVEIAPSPQIAMGPDVDECRDRLRPMLALYVGGMGPKGKNFYFDLVSQLGYGSHAEKIQEAFLAGRKDEAAGLVPDMLIDEVALAGPPERIADQLALWKESSVTTICLRTTDPFVIETVAGML